MQTVVSNHIADLVSYGIKTGLVEKEDERYVINTLLDIMRQTAFEPTREAEERSIDAILDDLVQDAKTLGIINADAGVTECDLFDTALMGLLTPRPSAVIREFDRLYQQSPMQATDYYYHFSVATNYIRKDRIQKDKKWVYSGKYGDLDITINLSKPEKDPKAIATAKLQKQTGYPKCALCPENEGFAGSMTQAPRQNHRIIPLTLNGKSWFLQYSPYVYYNEHCIVFSGKHEPMQINHDTFVRLLDFETVFPHYFIGSNADLPIVGGSILTHEHMQGGHYTFAMEKAPIEKALSFDTYPQIKAGIVRWPMSVIRLTSQDKNALIELSDKILNAWRGYSDVSANVLCESNGEKHNTITPIARRRGDDYEIDLVLRNNRTTDEYPMGIFHPHADKHNIKKENIGLIEVMGLAVLPARLKQEMALLHDAILENKDIEHDETLSKHYTWFCKFKDQYTFTKENTMSVLEKEIGKTFEAVLEDAGVYPCTAAGREAFLRFVNTVK